MKNTDHVFRINLFLNIQIDQCYTRVIHITWNGKIKHLDGHLKLNYGNFDIFFTFQTIFES